MYHCSYTTASNWLLKEHVLKSDLQNIKIDLNNQRAPTTVIFGPDVVKGPTSEDVSYSTAVKRGYCVRVILKTKARMILSI